MLVTRAINLYNYTIIMQYRLHLIYMDNLNSALLLASIISRCYVVAMFNMQHNALNLIFCTGPEGLNDTWYMYFEK